MVESSRNFDTHRSAQAGNDLKSYISNASKDRIIALAIRDEASIYYNNAVDAIRKIGGERPSLTYRSSYALLGYKGDFKVDWITEVYNERGKGPSVINITIQLFTPEGKHINHHSFLRSE